LGMRWARKKNAESSEKINNQLPIAECGKK
jgi:hypothetical protein